MSTPSFIFVSLLALVIGYLAQQSVEILVNIALAVMPFNIKTIS